MDQYNVLIYNSASSSFLGFANLYLISKHGIPGTLPKNPLRDNMIPYTGRFNRKHIFSIGFSQWVIIVEGTVTNICRFVTTIKIY